MNRIVDGISHRMSLRAPQNASLDILAHVVDLIQPSKDQDVVRALELIRDAYPTVEDFEREFPSLCFALATGVGKTRLMGAFITYLYQTRGIRHFFVLAPNLTIYNKLIGDFTPGNPKYVFEGISEFAQTPPEVITGDTYENGRGVRNERRAQLGLQYDIGDPIHINVFNISKINSEVRSGSLPRIKRLSEYIGQSYFDYLAELDDLVLIMDESHRYRATAGVRAINELKPILGLELTATPQVEIKGASERFKNVIYDYPLSAAMTDGFVKEPAVATRENFDADNYTPEQLEKLKLEDGVRIHENTKVELELFARQNTRPLTKPFMLVVAQDTTHADQIERTIKDDSFFEGRYKNRVITVHSKKTGSEGDEIVERLLQVESTEEPTEIVIHVNKLKEGWDVTNLYTIVPLRAAKAEILVHQTIGRGLRLPYGKRVGVPSVDRLTIVAHDRFQEIIDEANNPNSIIRAGVVIGRDIPKDRRLVVEVQPEFVTRLAGDGQSKLMFGTQAERDAAMITLTAIKRYERLPQSAALLAPEVQAEIAREVKAVYTPVQGRLEGTVDGPDVQRVVAQTIDAFIALSIDIPRIIVVPKGGITSGFYDFDLDASGIRYQPVAEDILIHHLRTNQRESLISGSGVQSESRPEDHLVRPLMEYDDVSYDEHADLLYKLAGQMVSHLRSYLANEDEVLNVLQYYQQALAKFVHAQMREHDREDTLEYEAHVSRGFVTLRSNSFTAASRKESTPLRAPVGDRLDISGMVFGGFAKCLYPAQKFANDTERRFAMLLEDDKDVRKWFRPAPRQFQIEYANGHNYEPDYVVETDTDKIICETKRADQMGDSVVQAKAVSAVQWCRYACDHELSCGGKPWSYALIPHDAVTASATLRGLVARYELS